jgi:RNA polymerase sigma factor (sigma-70 family)
VPFFHLHPEHLAAYRAGSPDVLAAVYTYFVDDVARALRRGFTLDTAMGPLHVPGVRGAFDLECGVQEVFLRVFAPAVRAAYDPTRPLRSYLLRVARNWQIDLHRSRARLVSGEVPPERGDGRDLEAEAESRQLAALVDRFLAQQTPSARAYFEARYHRGLSQTDAAAEQALTRIQGRRIERLLKEGLLRHLASHGHGRAP